MDRSKYIALSIGSFIVGAWAFYAFEPSIPWAILAGLLFGVAMVYWTLGFREMGKCDYLVIDLLFFVIHRLYWVGAVIGGIVLARIQRLEHHAGYHQSLLHSFPIPLLIALAIEVVFYYFYRGSNGARTEAGGGCGCISIILFCLTLLFANVRIANNLRHQAHPVKQEQR